MRIGLWAPLLLLIAAGGSAAVPDSSFNRIDSVIIENRNIFNTDSARYDYWIFKLANKLHIRTRKNIISRELLQKKGDIFSRDLADETERNLRTLPYIWDAAVELYQSGDSTNIMKVATYDRWTLEGGPSMSRTSGQTTYEIGFSEENLLGLGQYLSVNCYVRDFDRDYSEIFFTERRLLGSRHRLDFYYDGDPEVGLTSMAIERPLYSLSSRAGFLVGYSRIDRFDRYYAGGRKFAGNRTKGDALNFTTTIQSGTYNSKIRFGIDYIYKSIKITERWGDGIHFPNDSTYQGLFGRAAFYRIDYIRTARINGFSRKEDIAIGTGPELTIGKVFDNNSGRKLYDAIYFSYNYAGYWKSNLFFLNFGRKYRYNGSRDFRKETDFSIRYYNNRNYWITPVIFVGFTEDDRQDRTRALYLGENGGIRGYPKNFREGEKLLRFNIENRFFSKMTFLNVDFGAVQFVDFGQVWNRGERLRFRDMLWSIGAGLRLAMEKVSSGELLRIDLAYAGVIHDWALSFAMGQYIK